MGRGFVESKNRAGPAVTEYLQKDPASTGAIFADLTDIFRGYREMYTRTIVTLRRLKIAH